MREIIFTGIDLELNIKNGHPRNVWRHGSLIEYDNGQMGIVVNASRYGFGVFIKEVIPETVGQYTGLRDKNRKEIYEGDRIETRTGEHEQGVWQYGGVVIIEDIRYIPEDLAYSDEFEVVGNIHENPELLEV